MRGGEEGMFYWGGERDGDGDGDGDDGDRDLYRKKFLLIFVIEVGF